MAPILLAPLLTKGAALAGGALKYLPVIGAAGGAIPGLRKGNIGEAALGAGFGALTGGLGTGGLIQEQEELLLEWQDKKEYNKH